MKNKKLFRTLFLAVFTGVMSFSVVTTIRGNKNNNINRQVVAESSETTYFDKNYTTGWTASTNYETDVTPLGFYEGKYLRISSAPLTLCNMSSKSASGVYWVMKIDATEGNYLNTLKLAAFGRFYYSSGQNIPYENFSISTDNKSYSPISKTRCQYGEYKLRTYIDLDFSAYVPAKTSTLFLRWDLGVKTTSYGFSNDWTYWKTLKVTGTELPQAGYVEPSKHFERTVTDNFTSIALERSNAFEIQNISGQGNSHGVVPGFYGDPVNICNDLESFVTYYIPTNGYGVTEAKVNINAKIWNQNDAICHEDNKIKVLVSSDNSSFTLVKTFGCTDTSGDNSFKDLPAVDLSSYVKGFKEVYLRIVLVQDDEKATATGTQKVNAVSHNSFKYGLNNLGVKLGSVSIYVKAKYQCPASKQSYIVKDFSATGTDTLEDAVKVEGLKLGTPEAGYTGMYNDNMENYAYAVYKINAKTKDALISGLTFSFSNSRFAYYSGNYPTGITIYVSKNNVDWVEAAKLQAGTNKTAATLDASDAAQALGVSELFIKFGFGSLTPGCGSNKAWIVLSKISIDGLETVHVGKDRKDPTPGTCVTPGTRYLVCEDCEFEWDISVAGNHVLEHTDAKSKTCTADGNIEYWYCTECKKYFSDSTGTTEITQAETVIPASHELEHTDAKAKSCTENGNIEYWYCTDCKKYYSDAAATTEITQAETVIPASHELEHTDAKAKSCTADGNIEYWYCTDCKKYYSDAAATTEVTAAEIIIPASHELEHTDAKAKSCTEDGNIEYWYCTDCKKYYSDAAATTEITQAETVIPASHELEHTDAKAKSCTEDGNIEYWYCSECKKYYTDAEATKEVSAQEIVIPASHELEHHDRKEKTCSEDGNLEYWYCTECKKYFLDAGATKEVSAQDVVLPAGHEMVHAEAKKETCTEDGNIEYYYCEECEKYFADRDGKVELKAEDVVIKAHHNYVYVAEVAATYENEGMKEHYKCSECDKLFVKEASGEYKEVTAESLVIAKLVKKGGCGNSIVAGSAVALLAAAGILILSLKRKED